MVMFVLGYGFWLILGSSILFLFDKGEVLYFKYFAYMNPILRIMFATVWPLVLIYLLYTRWRFNDSIR